MRWLEEFPGRRCLNRRLRRHSLARSARRLLVGWALAGAGWAATALAATPMALLHDKYAAVAERLADNPFHRPLVLDSTESEQEIRGDIFARVDYPFAEVSAALNSSAHWCEVLILHINTKHCQASGDKSGVVLAVSIGSKNDQPLADAYRVEFAYRVVAARNDYLEVELKAESGPLGTSDYRIRLQAIAVDGGRTFLHSSYSYTHGFAGRLAMQAYLATVGRDKIGFTIVGRQPNGQPEHIRGVRGVIERNTMRYFLAIDTYLGTRGAPSPEQTERRLRASFDATERYAGQLHEMDRADYLAMKRGELRRQQSVQWPTP